MAENFWSKSSIFSFSGFSDNTIDWSDTANASSSGAGRGSQIKPIRHAGKILLAPSISTSKSTSSLS